MNYSRLEAQLTLHEGLRLKPYQDTVGKWTIGVGRNLSDVGITTLEATTLLKNDIDKVAAQLSINLPWWKTLDEVRQRVLADMCFNLGIEGLLKFKNTLALIKSGRYAEASTAMLQSLWASQVGQRARRLARMMATGEDFSS